MRRRAVRGVLLTTALGVVGTVIARVTQLVMPLFLLPHDFGIFAVAVFFSGLLALATELGMTTELVRRKERFEEAANTAFTLRLVLALISIPISAAIGLVVGHVYSEPRLVLPITVLSGGLTFQALSMVPRIIAMRALDFRRAAVPDSVGKFAAAFIAVGLAALGFAYWSPVYATIVGAAVGAGLQMFVSRWRPRLNYNRRIGREIVRFGQFVTLAVFANFLAHSVDNVLVGYLLGIAPLGYYAFAYSWGVYLTSSLTSVFGSVAYPIMSQVIEAPDRLRRAVSENLRYFGYGAFALTLGIIVGAPLFVHAVYGSRWEPAVIPMQVLAPVGLLLGYAGMMGDVLYALARPRRVFIVSLLELAAIVTILVPAALAFGLLGASLAAMAGAVVVFGGIAIPSSRASGLSFQDWLRAILNPLVAGLAAAGTTFVVIALLSPTLVALAIAISTFLATYLVSLQLLTRGSFIADLRALYRLAVT